MDTINSWICDECGDAIESPSKGLLVWDNGERKSNFRIVHKGQCDVDNSQATAELSEVTGPDGQVRLLAFLSYGPLMGPGSIPVRVADLDEWVDVFRRLQTPHYEEARILYKRPEVKEALDDANELFPYEPDTMRRLLDEYREER
ncbi:hypothetical protein BIU98_04425 [Curtobacterium sp. MMLR14_010]|uniref:hypothetical protein n=1 Tax=Curtobacterium sp. MMLR14_010 TaxID=1898743 RepID=UPI0008DC6B9B|nr:hypothetical protein [Curtobacterium sp. MMLR14_010]OII35173.1 hypothetical protein BIU98_04425 [Curtobacterium sp. MMLR14_010]